MSAVEANARATSRGGIPRGWIVVGLGVAGWAAVALVALTVGLLRF